MTVRGVKRFVDGYDGAAHEVYPSEELEAAMEGARAIIVCVPLTDETRGLIDAGTFAACDDEAVIVHVARGPVVDTDALLEALDENELRAAALDVFDEEPLPEESPLWDREDIIITPHAAGHTDKYGGRFVDIFLDRYERWERGEDVEERIV
jgi:phosphoglycerate dehydrogenase-like enzyme